VLKKTPNFHYDQETHHMKNGGKWVEELEYPTWLQQNSLNLMSAYESTHPVSPPFQT